MPRLVFDALGRQVDPVTLREVHLNPHGVRCKVLARTEKDAANTWRELYVSEARVDVYDPGTPAELSLRTVAPIDIEERENSDGIIEPILSWGQEVEVTPWGTWLQVTQEIFVPGLGGEEPGALGNRDNPLVVPWGAFLVTSVTTEGNTQTIIAKDALAMLETRKYVSTGRRRIVKNQTVVKDRVDDLIAEAWPHGTDPFLTLAWWEYPPDNGNAAVAETTEQYPDTMTRLEVLRSILARKEFNRGPDRDADGNPEYPLRMTITADPNMRTYYRISKEFDLKNPPNDSIVDIKAGQGLVSMQEIKSRDGIVNRAIVSWEASGTRPDGITTVTKKSYKTEIDLVATTSDEMSKIHVGQRFGIQTQNEAASGITTRESAERRAKKMIVESLYEGVQWSVVCSPHYGLWVDDVVSLRDSYGNTGYGRVEGMSVDLTQKSDWTVQIGPLNLIDSKSFGKPRTEVTGVEYQLWRTTTSKDVSEGMKTKKGWTLSDGKLSQTQTGLRATVTGDGFTLSSENVYESSKFDVARASFEIGVQEKVEARAAVDNNWGPWKVVRGKSTDTITSDTADGKPQPVSGKFAVKLQVRKLGDNGGAVDLNGVTIEVPGFQPEKPADLPEPDSDRNPEPGMDGATTSPAGTWVPNPDSTRAGASRSPREAVAWAQSQVGSYYPDGFCLAWVSMAFWGRQGFGGLYAKYVWQNKPAGAATWAKNIDPPLGSICVWNSPTGGNAGHVGIAIGNGRMISATGGRVGIQKIATFGSGGIASYYGAVEPY